jgi:excisionase family DNA binding protein
MSARMMEQEKELTLAEVAERLRISYQTARRRILQERLIRARKEGWEWRVKERDLEDYIRRTYADGSEPKE